MKAIVLGVGRMGTAIAYAMDKFGFHVVGMDTNPDAAENIPKKVNYKQTQDEEGNNTVGAMVSPAIDLTQVSDSAELSFWMHAYGATMGTLTVGIGTSATGPFTPAFTWSGELQTALNDPFQQVGIRLDNYVGQIIYVEFSFLTVKSNESAP